MVVDSYLSFELRVVLQLWRIGGLFQSRVYVLILGSSKSLFWFTMNV